MNIIIRKYTVYKCYVHIYVNEISITNKKLNSIFKIRKQALKAKFTQKWKFAENVLPHRQYKLYISLFLYQNRFREI